jgi:hypothetical protein
MAGAKSRRHQHFDGVPDHLVARVAEEALRLGVDEIDPSIVGGNDDCVRSRFQKPVELRICCVARVASHRPPE